MIWLLKASLVWFGNLRLRTKLYISFGWMCLFTMVLGVVCLGGIHRVRQTVEDRSSLQIDSSALSSASPESRTIEQRTEAVATQFQSVIVIMMAVILFIDFLMAWRLVHIIGDPVLHACEVLDKISRCDLTVEARVESEDEVGQMCAALNRTIRLMHDVLANLADSSDGLEKSAQELSDQTVCSTGNCHRQVDLAREVLTSTRLLAETGGQIARNSIDASEASRESSLAAQSGNAVMSSASQTMDQVAQASATIRDLMAQLDGRSREIGKVVATIREISENTNLLALNASIEAARAGEHGRGFAVVAGEVRRLAEHTRSATEEIAHTVESIQRETVTTTAAVESSRQNIENGQVRTQEASQKLVEIIRHADHSGSLAKETAIAAGEQSAASEQIASNAEQVADLAEASLKASGEVSKASSSIRNSAHQLSEIVHQFKL